MTNADKRREKLTIKYTKTQVPEDIIIQLLCESIYKAAQKNNNKQMNSTQQKHTKMS